MQLFHYQSKSLADKSLNIRDGNPNPGSGVLIPGAVFLRFFTEAFLRFLAPEGGSKPVGTIF